MVFPPPQRKAESWGFFEITLTQVKLLALMEYMFFTFRYLVFACQEVDMTARIGYLPGSPHRGQTPLQHLVDIVYTESSHCRNVKIKLNSSFPFPIHLIAHRT